NMEEPISYLAAAYSAAEGRPLENVVDLEMVEIQSKAEVTPQYRLGKQLFAPDRPIKPKMYEDSFALVDGEYEPNEAIKKYLSSRIADETKTHFGLPVENFSETVQEQFDVVSCNNVIQHLGGIEDYSSPYKNTQGEQDYARYYEELAKILNQVKAGGVLFIHAPAPGDKFDAKSQGVKFILDKIPNFENEFEELKPAVYRRKIKT
ncbi:MAG: hypothetical protein NTY61_01880, partial [Candidatus Parcubacteria bacterium]|nr:hypothetical protein [Candidatus Parcubacteria bacterium]